MPTAEIWADGACSGNPGPAGWGYLVKIATSKSHHEYTGSGYIESGTNNIAELTAAIEALRSLKQQCSAIVVYSDSKYVIEGITNWIHGWKRRNWLTSSKKPVANKALWEDLDRLNSSLNVKWVWVKGHAGNYNNEVVDQLAVSEYKKHME